jgi:hypothetical protein
MQIESVDVSKIHSPEGNTFVHVDMMISEGKFACLLHALAHWDTVLARELSNLIESSRINDES